MARPQVPDGRDGLQTRRVLVTTGRNLNVVSPKSIRVALKRHVP
jgi:hypothetical protein